MCRSIKPLFHFDPPATDEEIQAASLQFVRKLSGFQKPSKVNEEAFFQAIDEVSLATRKMFEKMTTDAKPRDREIEKERVRERSMKRFKNS